MRIPLDRNHQYPLYQQIFQFLEGEILAGELPAETKLPSTRELAQRLGVNRITISNAYAELEAQGLVYSRLGSGTYVAARLDKPRPHAGDRAKADWPLWQQLLAHSAVLPSEQERGQFVFPTPPPDDLVSFAAGQGAMDLFPVDDFRKALQSVLLRDRTEAMGYGERAGYLPLRTTIAQILSSMGVPTHPHNILITSGSQQAFSLAANLLLHPGDVVLMESPTYFTAIDLFSSLGARLVGVPVDEQGMQVELVEDLLRAYHPKLIHTIPTFHNPTGACMSGARRRQLVSLAEKYNVPILEDEFVGDLRYDGRSLPALKALDPGGYVIYTGTFSKMLMPGIRVGYLVASGPVYERLLEWKRITDLASSNIIQRALEQYITIGRYEAHLHRTIRLYRHRRDTMLAALTRHMPEGTSWMYPQGGLFVWVEIPNGLTVKELFPIALEEKVDFLPGSLFFPAEHSDRNMRLNFAANTPQNIEEGIRRLSKAIERCMQNK